MVQVFAPNGAYQPLDERMRHRGKRNGFDLFDLKDAQVGAPSIKSEQWIVVRAEVSGQIDTGYGLIKHAAEGDAINVTRVHPKADDASAPLVHDDEYPMGSEGQGFATKQISTPQTVLAVTHERQPRWSLSVARSWDVVLNKHAPYNVLINVDAKGHSDYVGNTWAAKSWIALF